MLIIYLEPLVLKKQFLISSSSYFHLKLGFTLLILKSKNTLKSFTSLDTCTSIPEEFKLYQYIQYNNMFDDEKVKELYE